MIDSFVFKKLSHNDTGQARGHQGGVVIPKDIAKFFPALPAVLPGGNPTVDVRLTADLFVDGSRLATVETRYAPRAETRDDTDGLSLDFGTWRMNLRGSNTEPLLRLNVESRARPDLVAQAVAEISALFT